MIEGVRMKRFIQGESRTQSTLLPEILEDYVADTNPVRVVDVFVDELDLGELGFEGVEPSATGRPAYHPSALLKLYIYGYLNRIQSGRRLEREAQRNIELMWLTGRLRPDFKTITNFRKDNGKAIRAVCRQFVVLCRQLGLLSEALVAIDGAKFKAVNNRDRNFTRAKLATAPARDRGQYQWLSRGTGHGRPARGPGGAGQDRASTRQDRGPEGADAGAQSPRG